MHFSFPETTIYDKIPPHGTTGLPPIHFGLQSLLAICTYPNTFHHTFYAATEAAWVLLHAVFVSVLAK